MITVNKLDRLESFIEKIKGDIYIENTNMEEIIFEDIESIKDRITPNFHVLDVGCGQGYALKLFKELGAEPIGITLNKTEKENIEVQGYKVELMDMSFLEFEDEVFDIVWARHSLEHSPFPLFTLSEWHRVLKPSGLLYLEVPAPNTKNNHEFNPNHYSVFGKRGWQSLLIKADFKLLGIYDIDLKTENGNDDLFYRIWAEK